MTTALDRASRSFPPEPVSAREARRFLRSFLDDRARDDLSDAALLALSEIVTNAVLHAHTPFDVTAALSEDGSLLVEVVDTNPQLPAQRDYGSLATTGRGMQLVAALTAECGVSARGTGSKAVWFVVRADDAAHDPLSGWDDEPAAEAPAAPSRTVVLRGLPPTLWLAAREHHDAVLRELSLFAQEHPADAPSLARFAEADRARGIVTATVVADLERQAGPAGGSHRALPPGHPSPLPDTPAALDLRVPLPFDDAEPYAALQDLLDAAERLAVAGRLLARPGLPEVVAVRDWVCEQIIAQLAGVQPSPWPGTGDERFTVEVHDRADAVPADWDAAEVSESDRGAVAADDANRIVAVSRPLAAALGWRVDDLVGRRVVALIPPELREAHVAGFTRHLTTGQSHVLGVPLRLPVLRADGSRVECSFLIEQAPVSSGRPIYLAWIEPVV